MQMNEILRLLKGVKGNGGQYQAHCPAHDDREPSLSISESDGKILLHCHAGCTKERILAVLGLEMKDLFIGEGIGNVTVPKREITAVYDYIDMDGKIVHSTIRYNPKSFSQRRPDHKRPGEYIYKDVFKGITPILYNLQAVTKAIKEKQPVLVVEGEKDCDNLKKYGIVATTCPMGAGKWHNHFSAMLNGGIIYIVADNDEVGNTHSEKIAKSLDGKVESIHFIDLTAKMPDTMEELPKGWDISDFLESTPQEARKSAIKDLIAMATPYIIEKEPPLEKAGKAPSEGKKSQAEMLLNLVEDTTAGFFHSTIKELYATIPVENHVEVLPLVSRDFEIWLNSLFYKGYGKPISKDAIKQVIGVLSAKALFDNPDPVKLSVRVAEHDGAFWYDLTNGDWQTVKITKDSWAVIDNPPILFERYRHQIRQTMPSSGGNINKILNYINIKENRTLFLCWLVSCFVPNIPHAILIIHGEKGAAKSTASAMTKSLIDPSALDTLTLSNDQRTLVVSLQQHWYLPFDNVSYINEDTSDTLCRASTGGAMQQRKLNTNADDTLFIFRKCIAINGIHNVATRADLLDRSILIELMRIKDSDRRELSEVTASFEADKADILGGIFDTIVKAMAIYPTIKLQSFPRMADFSRWGYAIGEALGEGFGQIFLDEFNGNRQIQNEEAIANDPVATLIVEFMQNRDSWYGRYSDLYKKLEDMADEYGINPKHKSFPADPTRLSRKITSLKSNLENVGIFCEREEGRSKHGQYLSINSQKLAALATPVTQTAENQGFNGVANSESKNGKGLPTPLDTPPPNPEKAHDIGSSNDNGVSGVTGVAKNPLLTESGEGWFAVCEDISDADIPSEFLKPTITK